MAVRVGGLVAGDHGVTESLGLGVEAPFTDRWSVSLRTGAWYGGKLYTRDTVVQAKLRLLDRPSVAWTLAPGLSLPSGSIGTGFATTPLSSGSLDPWLSTDLVAGGTWLVAVSGTGRASLYDGLDGTRQAPYGSVGLRGARRLGRIDGVPSVGLVAAGAPGEFGELAATAGMVWAPNERWGLSVDGRYPLVGHYDWAFGLSARRVFGEPTEAHAHEH